MRLTRALPPALAVAALALACFTPGASLDERTYAPPGPALERVAVIPFYAHRTYEGSSRMGGVSAEIATARTTALVAKALADRGVAVVDAAELAATIADVPRHGPAVDARIFAELVGRKLGATGVLVGEVVRYRDPRGASPAARQPASVAYQVTLYEAPEAYKLWTGRFDETQVVLPPADERDPGAPPTSVDWRSADDLAVRGAEAVAEALVRVQ